MRNRSRGIQLFLPTFVGVLVVSSLAGKGVCEVKIDGDNDYSRNQRASELAFGDHTYVDQTLPNILLSGRQSFILTRKAIAGDETELTSLKVKISGATSVEVRRNLQLQIASLLTSVAARHQALAISTERLITSLITSRKESPQPASTEESNIASTDINKPSESSLGENVLSNVEFEIELKKLVSASLEVKGRKDETLTPRSPNHAKPIRLPSTSNIRKKPIIEIGNRPCRRIPPCCRRCGRRHW